MPPQLGWREAAIEVLKDRPDGMPYADIAQEIIDRQLRTTIGATPAGSVNVAMSDSIKWDKESPFERTAPGWYRLRPQGTSTSPVVPAQMISAEDAAIEEKKKSTGLINALGMSWSRALVHWVPATPKMLGKQTNGSESVDFSDQRGVYLLYDRNDVIYVGRAIDQGIGTRLRQHTFDRLASRWDRFSWFGVYQVSEHGTLITEQEVYDRGLLIATMEALLIESIEPAQNRRRGDEFQAVEFLQVEDPEIERSRLRAMLAQIQYKIGS